MIHTSVLFTDFFPNHDVPLFSLKRNLIWAKRINVNAQRHRFAIKESRQQGTHIDFNREVVGPAGINDIFKDELVLGGSTENRKRVRESTWKFCRTMA